MPKGVYVRRNRNPPRRKQPSTVPDYHKKVVMTTGLVEGRLRHRAMAAREAARQLARQKGGLTTAARGTGHRWTSEEAREAARKVWKRRRLVRGVRVGVRSNRKPRVDRAQLRAYYAAHPTRGIQFHPPVEWQPGLKGFWTFDQGLKGFRILSERTALQKLGHLRSYRGYIPDTVTPVESGTPSASTQHRGEGAERSARDEGSDSGRATTLRSNAKSGC